MWETGLFFVTFAVCRRSAKKTANLFCLQPPIVVRFTMMLLTLKPVSTKMRLLPLVAATFFMVSGGPYGIEDILGGAGFGLALVILFVLPFLWSLPTALMIGELASSIPAEGGFYIWVRRALGPFWGYQESWLSLSASIFDMALYPAIFVLYLGKLSPALTAGWHGYGFMLAVVLLCCLWNLLGAPEVGEDSVRMFVVLLAPFAAFIVVALWHGFTTHPAIAWGLPHTAGGRGLGAGSAFSTAVLVAMWNYMGWDNASTVAREVENPQRNYPRAMVAATALTAICYILPIGAMAFAGFRAEGFATGDWVRVASQLGGPILAIAVVVGGCITGVGMFNALVMSYTRLPMAMAEDGMLPAALGRTNRRGVPWVSVICCGLAWALALGLPFERLIAIDLILYGSSLMLEFVALVVLRMREPKLTRPFRAGNLACACLLGVGPALLIGYALWVSRQEKLLPESPTFGSIPALGFAVAVALLGPVLYFLIAAPLARVRRRLAAAAD